MLQIFSFILALVMMCGFGHAQNLVPNPGFEKCGDTFPRSGKMRGALCGVWNDANDATSDYYHARADDPQYWPQASWSGSEAPHSGEAYVGICINRAYVEFIEAKLDQPLEKGKTYTVGFHISKADGFADQVSQFGVLLSNGKIKDSETKMGIKNKPQVVFKNKEGFSQTQGWICLKAEYTAQGGESYITLGCFDHRKKISAHYYIDDVFVIPSGSVENTRGGE